MPQNLDSIQKAIKQLQKGGLIVLVDDENRENEGDLILAAEKATPESVNFMARHGRGLICVPITEERAQELDLKLMADMNDNFSTAFTVSVDAKHNITTGISAYDRCETIKIIADNSRTSTDLVQPGHIFPLVARQGGVLQRAGHTEASIELMKLSALSETAVICEIMSKDGTMARLPELKKFAKRHKIPLISIKQLIEKKLKTDSLVERVAEAELPTEFGTFKTIGYRDKIKNGEYLALVKGDIKGKKNILVRVHSACLTGEVMHSKRCDCKEQLDNSMQIIQKEGSGVLLYILKHEGRGIGIMHKLNAYSLQDKGFDTVEANKKLGFKADLREYGFGAQILRDLGLTTIRILTNNPKKIVALEGYGLKVVERLPIKVTPNKFNKKYLETKKEKLGHLI